MHEETRHCALTIERPSQPAHASFARASTSLLPIGLIPVGFHGLSAQFASQVYIDVGNATSLIISVQNINNKTHATDSQIGY